MTCFSSKRLAIFLCAIVYFSINSLPIQAQDLLNALQKYDSKWGLQCDKCQNYEGYKRVFDDTYTVFFKNTSNIVIDVQVAVQEDNTAWRVYQFTGVHPLDELSAYACKATGKYLYWVKKQGDPELRFPSEEEIASNFK